MKQLRIVPKAIPQEDLTPGDLEEMYRKSEEGDKKEVVVDGDRHTVNFRKEG
jgi:hypothetical protein